MPETFKWKLADGIMRLLKKFKGAPKIAVKRQYFTVQYIEDHAFDSGIAQGMQPLLWHFNNHHLKNKGSFLVEVLDENDSQLKVVEELNPRI